MALAGGGRHILLVEDQALIALAEQATLERNGYTVRHVLTGEGAVDVALTDDDLELVLMDVDLGLGMDGITAAERILGQRELPVVFLSAHTEPELVDQTERVTSYGYVLKGAGDVVLLASIRMAFRLYDAKQHVALELSRRMRAEAELRTSAELLAKTEQLSGVGGWEWDVASQKMTWTSGTYRIHGVDPGDQDDDTEGLIAQSVECYAPKDRDRIRSLFERCATTGESYTFEGEFTRTTGERLWIHTRGDAIIRKGRVVRVIGNLMDLTGLKRSEVALKDRNERLAALLAISRDLGATLDIDTLLSTASDQLIQIAGMDTAAVYLIERDRLVLQASTPPLPATIPDEIRQARLAEHPRVRAAVCSRETTLLADARSAELTAAEQRVVDARNLRTVLYVPVVARDRVIGVFILGTIGTVVHVADSVKDLCNTIAYMIAAALQNALLCREAGCDAAFRSAPPRAVE